ncbi:hypothetical protein DVH24_014984 [Malus domestica]|uniref:F-box domain-containing protein n=1 Tax=Malus domestica TaxID=3750 RepID=A0A498K6W6_MALDO|nr:hypothetical protein DVH24_014984 [Malus domestica]
MRGPNGTYYCYEECPQQNKSAIPSGAVPPSVNICHSIRVRRSSATTSSWPSSKLMNSNIDDLPDSLLVVFFCQLPSYKSVSQCKCVSKRWCTLISDPHFIGCFLYLQRDRKQKPITTAINSEGEEFLKRMSPSSKPLNQLFQRLVSFHSLKQEPVVVGTYNDLVLCCASKFNQRDYYICNPYTIQWVPLLPPPQVCAFVLVGFICDLPYYNNKEDYQPGDMIQLNAEYRCRVVRLMDPDDGDDDYDIEYSREFKVQIFSSETVRCIAAYDGGVLMCDYDLYSRNLSICEVNEEEQDDQRVTIHGGAKSLFVKLKKRVNLVDEKKVLIGPRTDIDAVFFDPNDEDTLYMIVDNLGKKILSGATF